jgi:hypothetical protein
MPRQKSRESHPVKRKAARPRSGIPNVRKFTNQVPRSATIASFEESLKRAGVSRERAFEVYESLPEEEVVKMLCDSKNFQLLCRLNLDSRLSPYLRERAAWLRDKGGPAYAVDVFLRSRESGFRPPRWTLDWLDGRLRLWRDTGKLGFSEKRAFRTAKRVFHRLEQFFDVALLRELGANSIHGAAYLVCSREHPALRASEDVLVKNANTLESEFLRYSGRAELRKLCESIIDRWDFEHQKQYIEGFPRTEIRLHKNLRKFLTPSK